MAMSVPVPMAMPRSACAKAGESFIPSPTIATLFPLACSSLIIAALLLGELQIRHFNTNLFCNNISSFFIIARNHKEL